MGIFKDMALDLEDAEKIIERYRTDPAAVTGIQISDAMERLKKYEAISGNQNLKKIIIDLSALLPT